MDRFPPEFEAMLTAAGRRVLTGRSPLVGALAQPRQRFLAATGVVSARQARAAATLLDRTLYGLLEPLEQPIPPESIWEMTKDYGEQLPKTARLKTAYLERRRERAYQRAEEIGLAAMLRSESFAAFAAALAGRPLRRHWGIQLLCYGPGDYIGPHNDHHPEAPAAHRGYLDLHVSLAGAGVAQQWLVYAVQGHFSRVVDVATVGGVTAYRLPFWHHTTPLVARDGAASASARRWVLLGTFLYRRPPVFTAAAGPAPDSKA
ncbi:MAG TPA: hypothetical protein VMQ73_23295 [Methylomirabilota bacterium]|nr:hypothetical protein [Methylomirabilota bacterium]